MFYWVLLDTKNMSDRFHWFYWVLLGFTGFFTDFIGILLGNTRFY